MSRKDMTEQTEEKTIFYRSWRTVYSEEHTVCGHVLVCSTFELDKESGTGQKNQRDTL